MDLKFSLDITRWSKGQNRPLIKTAGYALEMSVRLLLLWLLRSLTEKKIYLSYNRVSMSLQIEYKLAMFVQVLLKRCFFMEVLIKITQ